MIIRESTFSECGKYRYVLTRIWDDTKPFAMCIGLNPSKAGRKDKDGNEEDDATISLLIRHLRVLGYGGLKMVNLYAFISTKPRALFETPDPLGQNDMWIETTAHTVQDVIFCWGAFKNIEFRAKKMIQKLPDGLCFGKTKNGSPIHPLALMYNGVGSGEIKPTKYQ